MIIAVIAVRVMQVAVDEVVDVIAVGYWLVTATRSVNVVVIVSTAAVRPVTTICSASQWEGMSQGCPSGRSRRSRFRA